MWKTDGVDVNVLLERAVAGEAGADSELLSVVDAALRAAAASYFLDEHRHGAVEPTALVQAVYGRLVRQRPMAWAHRNQYFEIASRAMRRILVEHVGQHMMTVPRDQPRITLDVTTTGDGDDRMPLDLEVLDRALTRLAALDHRKASLVELRFFGGLTSEDAAAVLGFSRSNAAEQWRMARAWLYRQLEDSPR